ncbi:MAG: hypothetical protein ACM33V_01480 [Chloroflexota bacterium]|nr:hypothetical protein [Anaerolineales bacterium]
MSSSADLTRSDEQGMVMFEVTPLDLAPLENYPLGVPTRFDFTLAKVNGWEQPAIHPLRFVCAPEN